MDRYFKIENNGVLIAVGIGIGGEEITAEEYYMLLPTITADETMSASEFKEYIRLA